MKSFAKFLAGVIVALAAYFAINEVAEASEKAPFTEVSISCIELFKKQWYSAIRKELARTTPSESYTNDEMDAVFTIITQQYKGDIITVHPYILGKDTGEVRYCGQVGVGGYVYLNDTYQDVWENVQ